MKLITDKKILIWDLETSPALTYTWGLYGQNIAHEYVVEPWSILCVAYKDLGGSKVNTISVFDKDNNNTSLDYRDDYLLCKKLREIVSSADILVAHNGDSFDLKMFNTRLIYHGLEPVSPYILTVDTKREAKRVLRAPSHSMDFLCRYFGIGSKIRTDKYLWLDIISKDSSDLEKEKAMNKMVKYCAHDIKVNENLYKKLMPYMKSHPNLATPNTCNCPKCNSSNVVKNGVKVNKGGISRQEYICKNCGSYFSSRLSIREAGKSLSKL